MKILVLTIIAFVISFITYKITLIDVPFGICTSTLFITEILLLNYFKEESD